MSMPTPAHADNDTNSPSQLVPCDFAPVPNRPRVYVCRRCGRTIGLPLGPDGQPMPLDPTKLPPCGYQPFGYSGHLFAPYTVTDKLTRYQCQFCGMVLEYQAKVPHDKMVAMAENQPPCRATPQDAPPGIMTKALHYGKALAKWAADGLKSRPQEEIDRIWEICKACDMFGGVTPDDPTHSFCKDCGCRLSKDPNPVRNKIAMPTEHCHKYNKW